MRNIKTHNLEPVYLTSEAAFSDATTDTLIDLVNEKGKLSTWNENPRCLEYQIANPFSRFVSEKSPEVSRVLPDLFAFGESCMRHMNRFLQNTACDIITGHHGFWILRYNLGGEFTQHCDWDSGPNGIRPPIVATACVLLNDDFKGGETLLFKSDNTQTIIPREKQSVLMWDGFTQHTVAPITEGFRYALVVHYTGTIK
jgi:hypothetical protein